MFYNLHKKSFNLTATSAQLIQKLSSYNGHFWVVVIAQTPNQVNQGIHLKISTQTHQNVDKICNVHENIFTLSGTPDY